MKYLESADLLGCGRSLLTPESRSTRCVVAWKYALMNVGHWWKANFKASGQLPAPHSGHAATIIYGVVLLIYSTKTQITPKIQSDLSLTITDPGIKCHCNPFINFWVMFTNKQTNQQYQKHTLALALSLDQSGLYQLDNLHEWMYSLNYVKLTPKLTLAPSRLCTH